MKKIILLGAMLLIIVNINAQYNIKGIVKDIQNNQPIPGAKIKVPSTNIEATSKKSQLAKIIKNKKSLMNFNFISKS